MQKAVDLMKAVSDEGRIRILSALSDGELCICQVIELLELAPSTVSKHLTILKHAGLIKNRKEGKWIYIDLNDDDGFGRDLLKLLLRNVSGKDRIMNDRAELKKIKRKDLAVICRKRGKLK